MSSEQSQNSDPAHDVVPLEDLPAKPADESDAATQTRGGVGASTGQRISARSTQHDDEVIRIEDLTPRENVKGGRKIVLGEIASRRPPEDPV